MAYDRYESGGGRGRDSDDRFERERERGRDRSYGRDDDRGFFERAGEGIRSWFRDDEDEDQRGRRDPRMERERMYGERRDADQPGWGSALNWDRERGSQGSSHAPREDRSYGRSSGSYRPVTGDYGRSERPDEDFGRSRWEQESYRQTSSAGSAGRANPNDEHYSEWRRRQMEELDRDYDEYRKECRARFESEFGSWREQRQQKRQMLGQIRENMEVLGSDGEHVGRVDRVAGERIILAKSDGENGGVNHSLSCTELDRIEDDRVMLNVPADQARERWRDESRERALFEREDQGSAGAHMLERSFSGTYR